MIPLGQLRAGTLLDGDEAGGARRGRRRGDVARRPRVLPTTNANAAAADHRGRLRLRRGRRGGEEGVDLILGALQFPPQPLSLFVALLDYRLK